MENKFLTFIKPYLSFIDDGRIYRKPFTLLYAIIAILNLIFPLNVFYIAIDNRIFDSPAKFISVFLILWVVIAFAGWVSFQLWWDRKSKINDTSSEGDDFVATPVFSHFFQTTGEWLGTWIGFVGFFCALITTIILGDEAEFLLRELDISLLGTGWTYVFAMPMYGFLIIVTTRFLAEQFRAISAIANNTKKQ